jgi:hypothetical protein
MRHGAQDEEISGVSESVGQWELLADMADPLSPRNSLYIPNPMFGKQCHCRGNLHHPESVSNGPKPEFIDAKVSDLG